MVTSSAFAGPVAAIDIGTNSILLTIAEYGDAGPQVLVDRATVTRLGAGVDKTRTLSAAAVKRSLDCLQDYATLLAEYGVLAVDAVGTSALRDSTEALGFLNQAEAILGVRPRIIGGLEEAQLTCSGALSGLSIAGPFVLFDVGGGSTEIVVGQSDADHVTTSHAVSLDIGCVRLSERFLKNDPPTHEELMHASAGIDAALQTLSFDTSLGPLIGTAGTVTTLAAIELGLTAYDPAQVHGSRLTHSALRERFRILASQDHGQRLANPALSVGRADIIVVGSLIVLKVMEFLARDEMCVSDRGVRFGLLQGLFARQSQLVAEHLTP